MEPDEILKDPRFEDIAAQYLDLLSIQIDLSFTIDATSQITEIGIPPAGSPGTVVRSLWSAGTIAYRRCFASGRGHGRRRSRLVIPRTVIECLPTDMQGVHELTLRMADEHIAHRVDDSLNQMRVGLKYAQEQTTGERRVIGIPVLGAIFIGPQPADAWILKTLAETLLVWSVLAAQEKHQEMFDLASSFLAPDVM
jgi:hypothetical protein